MPALFNGNTGGSANAISDRELLLKALSMGQMISEMRNEINDLRQAVAQLAHGVPLTSHTPVGHQGYTYIDSPSTPANNAVRVLSNDTNHEPEENLQDAEVVDEEPLALEEREKKAIRTALERHGGRRTLAAQDLHISERTLYRKIKEYGIEI